MVRVPSLSCRSALAVVAITLLSAHVAPSVDDNNRYLKLTPLGDRVRLAYTVFFGEVPGAAERRTIDANRDGRIDDAEAKAFAESIAAQVAAALVVEIDGTATPVTWDTSEAGMGTPQVAAGAFSVDLIAYLCMPKLGGRHRVVVHDRFRIPRPGETEAKVEDGPPGVTIERAHVGPADDPTWDYRFAGPGGPLESDGLEVVFFVANSVAAGGDARCTARTAPVASSRAWSAWWLVGTICGSAVALAAVLLAVRLRRR